MGDAELQERVERGERASNRAYKIAALVFVLHLFIADGVHAVSASHSQRAALAALTGYPLVMGGALLTSALLMLPMLLCLLLPHFHIRGRSTAICAAAGCWLAAVAWVCMSYAGRNTDMRVLVQDFAVRAALALVFALIVGSEVNTDQIKKSRLTRADFGDSNRAPLQLEGLP